MRWRHIVVLVQVAAPLNMDDVQLRLDNLHARTVDCAVYFSIAVDVLLRLGKHDQAEAQSRRLAAMQSVASTLGQALEQPDLTSIRLTQATGMMRGIAASESGLLRLAARYAKPCAKLADEPLSLD